MPNGLCGTGKGGGRPKAGSSWPWGATYEKPQPIRVCYPSVALRDRAVHFCGVSDIIEPRSEWRAFKKALTGRDWDYDFRRLFYTWTPDIASAGFRDWIEIASREKTCGWISPGDLWLAPDGAVHLLWTERALDERLRDKFFPGVKQSHSLNHAILREGKVLRRQALVLAEEGGAQEVPGRGCFQATPDNRLFVFFPHQRTDRGRAVGFGEPGAGGGIERRGQPRRARAPQSALHRFSFRHGAGGESAVRRAGAPGASAGGRSDAELRADQAAVSAVAGAAAD